MVEPRRGLGSEGEGGIKASGAGWLDEPERLWNGEWMWRGMALGRVREVSNEEIATRATPTWRTDIHLWGYL